MAFEISPNGMQDAQSICETTSSKLAILSLGHSTSEQTIVSTSSMLSTVFTNTRGVDGNQRSARTNSEMVDDLQMRFIDFVYYDPPQEDPKLGVKNVETILYDQGRRSRIIDTTVDTRFADDQTRYDAVLESWAIAEAIVSAVIGRTK